MQRLAFVVLALAVGGAAITIAATAGSLPATVASSFGAGGRAQGWMSREAYLGLMLGLTVGIPALLAASIAWLPRLAIARVNIPNREHWLAPARHAATLATLAVLGCGLGVEVAAFVAGIHLLVVAAQTTVPPRLPETEFAVLMAVFGLTMVAWIGFVLLRFRKPR